MGDKHRHDDVVTYGALRELLNDYVKADEAARRIGALERAREPPPAPSLDEVHALKGVVAGLSDNVASLKEKMARVEGVTVEPAHGNEKLIALVQEGLRKSAGFGNRLTAVEAVADEAKRLGKDFGLRVMPAMTRLLMRESPGSMALPTCYVTGCEARPVGGFPVIWLDGQTYRYHHLRFSCDAPAHEAWVAYWMDDASDLTWAAENSPRYIATPFAILGPRAHPFLAVLRRTPGNGWPREGLVEAA
jgi:hypothetical protein